ncbi:HNH endonuclease [Ferrimonas balearica]|uniref:HNH endonuclease n=1 Tax=Ferrimonas balearica TaxID=44012 RepID=UPI001F21834E|nr:HNH endonuclease signature motif containing protein [Ferrimonas balearica]MBY6095369.1 HNH endonuclease [Ferrimonas balearica]
MGDEAGINVTEYVMIRVTYSQAGRQRRKTYQTERAAKRSIRRWLEQSGEEEARHAILYVAGSETRMFRNADELEPALPTSPGDFYRSQAWLTLRAQAFIHFGNHCACCGAKAGPDVALQVDHIKPRSLYPELALELDNLQILCRDCNLGKSNRFTTQWR